MNVGYLQQNFHDFYPPPRCPTPGCVNNSNTVFRKEPTEVRIQIQLPPPFWDPEGRLRKQPPMQFARCIAICAAAMSQSLRRKEMVPAGSAGLPPEKKQEIDPVAISELFTTLPVIQGKSRPIKILTRLMIVVSDPSHCNVLRATSSRVQLYDIVAVFPKIEKRFHVACTHLDVDLVCITVTEKLPFYFKRPPINVAIDQGLGFELVYSPAIKDSTMRRYTVSNALNVMHICKGKNIIISSAAERPLDIRRPYDVAHLGLLFGLSESDAKAAVSTNCRAALLHGDTTETAFGIISTVKKPWPSEGDDDSFPACKKAKSKKPEEPVVMKS
ncbi:ribonuclease P protein subunit p30-like [Nycticebus coucang]|uniref:ribonuclease P protein subunit p30-like n=1 Tax=Nycticebus coucang TaxID=9470 RepID=UPI00234D46E9|nr:ribonuclease P protein subunit p30-like [Nycticebus coucang]